MSKEGSRFAPLFYFIRWIFLVDYWIFNLFAWSTNRPSWVTTCRCMLPWFEPGQNLPVCNRGRRDRIFSAFSGIGDGFDARGEK